MIQSPYLSGTAVTEGLLVPVLQIREIPLF